MKSRACHPLCCNIAHCIKSRLKSEKCENDPTQKAICVVVVAVCVCVLCCVMCGV